MRKLVVLGVVLLFLLNLVLALGLEITPLEKTDISDNTKTLITPEGEEMVIDYSNGVVTYMGIESPIISDDLVMAPIIEEKIKKPKNILEEDYVKSPSLTTDGFVHLEYYLPDSPGEISFDVYIEETFYASNQVALDDFWDKFAPRYEILKEQTGWSSLKWFGVPLEIYVYGHSAACYGGNASPTHSNVVFSDPMYKVGCHKPYYEDGVPYYNNPGELGDWWPYMNTALHEALHSINPYPIYTRSWLTEGWSEYYMYNVLVESGDINQETADTYLHNGFAGYQWDPYVANDFHDTTVYNRELQRSHGYDITGHMFSKMRDEEGLNWDTFYELLNNNKDALDRTFSLGPPYIYYTDAFVLNIFGKAMGDTNYWTETDLLFNYYSTPGHGYGARNISSPYNDFAWFGDLTPTSISFSKDNPEPFETIDIIARVENMGDVNMKDVVVRFYDNDNFLEEQIIDINKFSYNDLMVPYGGEAGSHNIEVRVDEDNIKIELDDFNNNYLKILEINTAPVLDPIGNKEVVENSLLTIEVNATDADEDTLSYFTDAPFGIMNSETGVFEWTPSSGENGIYLVKFWVSDGPAEDEETITINVTRNSCQVCGDLNDDDIVDMGDLTELINYLFISFEVPGCGLGNSNVDGVGIVDMGDLTRTIDYLFISYDPLTCGGEYTLSNQETGIYTQEDYDFVIKMIEDAQPKEIVSVDF